jgi:thiol-disulfide isomerase/thioredoxin
MDKKTFILSLIFCLLVSTQLWSQEPLAKVEVYERFEDMAPLLEKDNDTLYIINFWATWCKPCIQELPYFEEVHEKYKTEKIKVILVSLDFKKHMDKRVIPFIEKNNIQSKVVLLNDGKPTYWIDSVSEDWSGAIPATLFYNRDKRIFKEQEFYSLEDIESIITKF